MRTLKEIQELYQQAGVKALRDVELLQLLGINLESCDFLDLFKSSREALIRKGFRASTAIKLNALGEVAHRYSLTPIPERESIQSSSSIAAIMSPILKHLSHEECWVVYLNRANKVLIKEQLSIGGVCATVVDVKIILKRALELLASSLILIHNHPSGNAKPGENDKVQTKLLKGAADLFDITLLDHVIIAGDGYFSFADDGIM